MQIDNMEDIKILLQDIESFFSDLDNVKKKLENEISIKEAEQEDYLHELELGKLNGIEIVQVAKALINTRKQRRVLKDKLDLINTLKGYTDKFITKGIIADTKQALTNIETLKKNHETRSYVPRVIKDLKCVRKKEKAHEDI